MHGWIIDLDKMVVKPAPYAGTCSGQPLQHISGVDSLYLNLDVILQILIALKRSNCVKV